MVKFQPQALHPNDFSPGLKMPKAKINHGKLKKIRCLWCRKKFCSKTNVLQHMNQPMGLCYAVGWYKDHALRTLYQPPQDLPDSSHHPDLDSHVQTDMDVDHYDSLHLPSDQWSQGFDDDTGDIRMEVEDISDMWQSFTSIHPGCGTSFPGGSTCMDSFWQDAHTKEQRENLFYPFASSEEWQFSSWCMHLGLSMSTIDSLLSLNIIKQLSLSLRAAKELRVHVESSRWATMVMQTHETGLSHQAIHLFILSPSPQVSTISLEPSLLAPHISFVPQKVWTLAAHVCHTYEDWLSGDHASAIQVHLISIYDRLSTHQ
ncbi:hypothetical protein EV401DRAFT_2079615 [Pisolithus croceorrhizus]|nr:hypothetical protein EV401DRAFT_2079615 [Pisolithus croceorrhizus]